MLSCDTFQRHEELPKKIHLLATVTVVKEVLTPRIFSKLLWVKRHFDNGMKIFTSIFIAID
jgi:hypothetical protein